MKGRGGKSEQEKWLGDRPRKCEEEAKYRRWAKKKQN